MQIQCVDVEQGVWFDKIKSADTAEFSAVYRTAPYVSAVVSLDVTDATATGDITIDIQTKATNATNWETLKAAAFSAIATAGLRTFTIPEPTVEKMMSGQLRLRVVGSSLGVPDPITFSVWIQFRPY